MTLRALGPDLENAPSMLTFGLFCAAGLRASTAGPFWRPTLALRPRLAAAPKPSLTPAAAAVLRAGHLQRDPL